VIPTSKVARAAATPQATLKATEKTTPAKTIPGTYTVKKNDTLVGIARHLNVSYADLTKLNGIKDPKKLQEGQVLKVPKRS
jgi:LysM repeat protein